MKGRKRTKRNSEAGGSPSEKIKNVDQSSKTSDKEEDLTEEEEEDQNPAINEALQNPLVLLKIMEELDFLDLRNCRLVCRTWDSISSSVMLKKSCCLVKLKYDWERSTYRKYRQPASRLRDKINIIEISESHYIVELNKILAKSTNFPTINFVIFGGNLGEPHIQSFFELYGMKIKTLALMDIWDDDEGDLDFTSKDIFLQVLQKVPNVETLRLRDLDFEWDEKDDKVSLPFLKNFSWEGGCDTAIRIMMGAPNFKTLDNFDLQDDDHLKAVLAAGKVPMVEELVCDEYTNADDLHSFLKSGGSQTKLKNLEFDVDKAFVKHGEKMALTRAFNSLLESSKDTLETLDLSELSAAYFDVKLPKFSRLKELAIGRKFARPAGQCFPPRIDLRTTFPKLRLLDCTGVRCDVDASWDKHFPPPDSFSGDFESVETLEILDNCRENWMFKLQSLCPNFKKLVVNSEDQPHIMLPKIFRHWQHLESIEIKMQGVRLFNLDSAFTGISAKTCARLRSSESEEREEGFENFPYRPSLCNLTGLRHLKMRFDPDSYRDLSKAKKTAFISCVSGLYAFNLMPDLRVTIEFDHNCPEAGEMQSTFESVGPYVNFAHNHNCFD